MTKIETFILIPIFEEMAMRDWETPSVLNLIYIYNVWYWMKSNVEKRIPLSSMERMARMAYFKTLACWGESLKNAYIFMAAFHV